MSRNRVLILLASSLFCNAQGQVAHRAPAAPPSLRLYVFDCGTAKLEGKSRTRNLGVPCYLIAHPRGTLMWDTGLVLDGAESRIKNWFAPAKSLREQLASIGYFPQDITFLAFSHYHSDHTANANMFKASTWLVTQAEREVMFSDKVTESLEPKDYKELKGSKTITLPATADYDVFGDGTVLIIPAPGHTPGHQVLFVQLPKFGPVIVAGDLYLDEEDRQANKPKAGGVANGNQVTMSRIKIEDLAEKTHAPLWIEHDFGLFSKLMKGPKFYE